MKFNPNASWFASARFTPLCAGLILGALCLSSDGASPNTASTPKLVGEQADGGVLVTTNQFVTPLGKVQRIDGARPKDMALSPDGATLAVLTTSKVIFYKPDGTLLGNVVVKPGPLGLAWQPDGLALYASGEDGAIYRIGKEGDAWKAIPFRAVDPKKVKGFSATDESPPSEAKETSGPKRKNDPQVAGLVVSPDGQRLYAALGINNAVSVVDLNTRQSVALIPTGIAPYRIALSPDGKTLYCANRGGRAPRKGEASAPSAGTKVRVDPRTDAALRGSLTLIDTEKLTAVEIEAGRQPSDMVFSADGKTMYVANSDEDTVGVFDTGRRKFRESFSLRPPQDPGFGQIPNALGLSSDGKTLYVTCGGANAVAALDLPSGKISGYYPAGWYPIAVTEREGRLFIASSKGFGTRYARNQEQFKVTGSVGTVQFIEPAQLQLISEHTRRVALNNGWGKSELPPRPGVAAVPIPDRAGEPSLFKHVVFIIKENHTYDSTLGDMKEGNGEAKICMFGEEVTPNQHALARQWVLLDNTYTSGTNSADGHQWTVSAVANGYMEQNYAAHSRSYPYDGGDPLAYSPEGFLWNSAVKAGRSLRVYGEFVNTPRVVDKATGKTPVWKQLWEDYQAGGEKFAITAETDNAALRPYLHPHYIGFPTIVSDQWRADQFLADLKEFEASGKMPDLSILLLPNDHTTGTKPNFPTPRAAVADNDLALGRIVEGLSHSRFWKETLILVIEDDSQLGMDHVDGHRTTAFCISPYTRRRAVVSEVYNHTSFLRTMELVLGLPAMNRFDRTATPMTTCFADEPDATPFTHLANRIPLDEMNPPVAALRGEQKRLAQACARLDWSDVDKANPSIVARAVWQIQRPGEAFPRKWYNLNVKGDDD
ncbi:MAG: alkaline phosphatase family protein [Chthoniobacter sp.]|nr:alkaline phosphatase family protein [Chthoniobacter sp.]